jgi:diguanylate cyclase (GGDEF)-like protein
LPSLQTTSTRDSFQERSRSLRPGRARRFALRRPWFLPEGRQLSDEAWRERHRGITAVLWLHVPVLYVYGLMRGFSATAVLIQVSILALPATLAMWVALSRNIRSACTSAGLVMGASVMVHLSGGSIEAYFQFFVVLALLSLYQAWLPFLFALVYVVGEHGVVGMMSPQSLYNNPSDIENPWRFALIHGAFVLAAATANVLSWRLTEREALRDGLTCLPNRVCFVDALDRILDKRGHGRCAVVFMDLDNFKDANDAFGHHVGDSLLIAVARRIERQLRTTDMVARLGGDEFAILLVEPASEPYVRATAQRLLTVFAEPVRIGDLTIGAHASIGIAFADDGARAVDLLRNAELAMYDAKPAGGRKIREYRAELHDAVLLRTQLETELRSALKEEQFVIHYQPIIDLVSGRMTGTEALVRWQHPTRGLLAPGEFIPVAEASGLIVPLGAWVLRTACRQTAEWQQLAPDQPTLTVAVNLSPLQLREQTLIETVVEALQSSGLEAHRLCLEITEGSVIKDFDASLQVLNALRTIGVSLALDDFGTGYSSLSYLNQLPVSSVKIDRSFVFDMNDNVPNAQIVLAIIDLAHALGMSVTAEGAETRDQLTTLIAMHSDHAQGYLFGRPMAPEDMQGHISRQSISTSEADFPPNWSALSAPISAAQ